ncbi:helix-turn-helix domain-containing protein [Streptomyces sp. NPDC002076]
MRWKELPRALGEDECQLVAELRRLKDKSGLSLKSLQAKTPFSTSSWERYLNGKVLPPTAAVEALAKLVGEDPAPLLALRHAAGIKDPSVRDSGDGSAKRQGGEARIRVGALTVSGAALLLSAVTSVLLIVDAHTGASEKSEGVTGVGKYTCRYTRRGDMLYAGNSDTTSQLVMRNNTGRAAAEVQCLLLRHRLSPGDIDGYFGEHTETEVKQLQHQDHVPVDGIVGEQTWGLLRHVD